MKRIYLRAFEPDDYLLISKWRNDPEITKLLGGNHYFISQARDRNWVEEKSIKDNTNLYLAICLLDNNDMIGYFSVTNIDLRNLKVDLGGMIIGDKSLWGKGYAKETFIAVVDYLFAQYPIHKITNYMLEEHKVTVKMTESIGFTYDGIKRDDIFKNGEFKSVLIYSMLRDEYGAKYGKRDYS